MSDLPKPKVFLSYNSKDRDEVRLLYRALEQGGLEPWMDDEDRRPGGYWRRQIFGEIQASDAMLVCLGPNGWGPVQKLEVLLGLERHWLGSEELVIVPYSLATSASDETEWPKFLNHFSRVGPWDLGTQEDVEDFRQKLRCESEATGAAQESILDYIPAASPSSKKLVACFLVVFVLLLGTVAWARTLSIDREKINARAAALEATISGGAFLGDRAATIIDLELGGDSLDSQGLKDLFGLLDHLMGRQNLNKDRLLILNYLVDGEDSLRQGDFRVAVQSFRSAAKLTEAVLVDQPDLIYFTHLSALCHHRLGETRFLQESPVEALEHFEKALLKREKLAKTFPEVSSWNRDLAIIRNKMAPILVRQLDYQGASQILGESSDVSKRLMEEEARGDATCLRDAVTSELFKQLIDEINEQFEGREEAFWTCLDTDFYPSEAERLQGVESQACAWVYRNIKTQHEEDDATAACEILKLRSVLTRGGRWSSLAERLDPKVFAALKAFDSSQCENPGARD
ncbi:MAG: toll/interleukin-1 receptor domain-containing protein [Acidobacteriota bacterium]